MIEIVGSALYQWDTARTVNADVDIDQIHLSNPGDAYAAITDGSTVTIPNYLLQSGKPVVAYAVKNGATVESKTFPVHKRERPENYVYDEDRRNFIYELIANAEEATQGANEAADKANEAADRADQFAGDVEELQNDVEAVQGEVVDLRTDFMGGKYDSAGEAVRVATTDLNARIQELDDGFEPRVEETVVASLQDPDSDIHGNVQSVSEHIASESLFDAGLVEYAENGEPTYHAKRDDNPHQVTAEQVGAVTKDQHDDDIAYVNQNLDDTRVEFEGRIELIQSSLDSLDASQIGAAPAGYGLGETSAKANNWNAGYWNMFARSNQNSPDGKWWYGLVCREQTNTGTTTEIAFSVDAGSTVLEARRSRNSGSNWGEWEYVNPPMVEGVEYRTTERWKGKPVYTKLIDCGTAENGKFVDLQNAVYFVRVSGWVTAADGFPLYPIPHISDSLDSEFSVWLTPNYEGFVTLNCGSEIGNGAYTFSVQIWYVK